MKIPSNTIISMEELVINFLSEELLRFPWYPLDKYSASIFMMILMHLISSRENKPKKTTNSEMKIVTLPFSYLVRMKNWFVHESIVEIYFMVGCA